MIHCVVPVYVKICYCYYFYVIINLIPSNVGCLVKQTKKKSFENIYSCIIVIRCNSICQLMSKHHLIKSNDKNCLVKMKNTQIITTKQSNIKDSLNRQVNLGDTYILYKQLPWEARPTQCESSPFIPQPQPATPPAFSEYVKDPERLIIWCMICLFI